MTDKSSEEESESYFLKRELVRMQKEAGESGPIPILNACRIRDRIAWVLKTMPLALTGRACLDCGVPIPPNGISWCHVCVERHEEEREARLKAGTFLDLDYDDPSKPETD